MPPQSQDNQGAERVTKEGCCPACSGYKRFFFFAIKGPDGDMTLSIPAEDEAEAMKLLGSLVVNPEQWERELDIEKQMNEKRTTGRKKKPEIAPGPMFG